MKYELDYRQPHEIDNNFPGGGVNDRTVVFQLQTVPFESPSDGVAREMAQEFLKHQGVVLNDHSYPRKPVQLRKVEVISL